jgi:hypothetical protein
VDSALLNFAGGETTPRSRGRFDAPWYPNSCKKLLNFTPEVPGSARYRSAFKFLRQTRGGAVARIIEFEVNNTAVYKLEFTSGKMRVYDVAAEDLLTTERTTVTHVTKANPAILAVAATTNLSNGDEIIITGIDGMDELNGRQVKLANGVGLGFQLVDPVTGLGIDSTNFGAYASGGTVYEVYEIDAPYLEAELDDITFTQSLDTMYLFHPNYQPRKVSVDSGLAFTLATFTRTNDPLNAYAATLTITAITRGTTTLITFTAGDVINPNVTYDFSTVVGTTQLNGGSYRLVATTSSGGKPRAYLKNASTGANVNSSAWTAYSSGGIAESPAECPLAGAFVEGRLGYFGTNQRPDTTLLSRAPDDDGNTRYDDFTGGANADDACFFALAPVNGKPCYIAWARGTSTYLFVGTQGGPFRMSGGGLEEPITQDSINVRQFDSAGCKAAMPAGTSRLFFIQRGGRKLLTAQFSDDVNDFRTYDMTLNAGHIGAQSPLKRVILQTGSPNIVWVIREDGILAGMSIEGAENVAGWHRLKIGGTDAKVLDASPSSRTDRDSQLWIVSERTVNGVTRRCVEAQADDVDFPDIEDFFGGSELIDDVDDTEDLPGPMNLNQRDDLAAWRNAVYRRQEEYIYLDAAETYNGSDRGVAALASLTPSALTGDGITITSDISVFTSDDVGDQIWKKPSRDTGLGGGRATITAVSANGLTATCDVIEDFDTTAAISYGDWYFATGTFFGLWHLEGEIVGVLTDGSVYSDGRGGDDYPLAQVANGQITLDDSAVAAVVHVGLPYDGFLQSQNLAVRMQSGTPALSKPRNIAEMRIRLLDTLGVEYGTDLYNLEQVQWEANGDYTDRPPPTFSGIRRLPMGGDTWSGEDTNHEKYVFVAQRLPLPCVVQSIEMDYAVADE